MIERFFPRNEIRDQSTVLFTGRLVAAKGIRYLVNAMPNVLKEHPEVLFRFIGPGDRRPYIKRLHELNVSEKNFSFNDHVPYFSNILEKLYQTSSIFVLPSLHENFPISILEAMSCGILVIASNICGIPEAVRNKCDGLLIKPGSDDELAEAISLLLDDEKLRKKMGENARKTVLEQFDWNINTINIMNIYKQILNRS